MKHKYIPIILVLLLLTFTACSGNSVANGSKAAEVNAEFESLSDVKNDILSTETEYENMTIQPEALKALSDSFPDKADCVQLKQASDHEQLFDKVRPLFIADEDYKSEYYQGFDNALPAGNVYDDGENYLNVASNGGIGFLSGESAYDCEVIKTVFIDRDFEDEEVTLDGQKYKLSQGVKYVNDFLQKLADNGFGDMRISYVDVLKFQQENALFFHIQRTVEGMELNRFFYSDGDFDQYPYFGAKLYMTSPDKVGEFLGDHGFCEISNVTKSLDKYVTLRSALDICENTLAANHKYTVSEIGFGYMPKVVKANGEDWNKETDGQFYFQEGTTYESEPGWFIWLDTTIDSERMVFVNAITGEPLVLFNNEDMNIMTEN